MRGAAPRGRATGLLLLAVGVVTGLAAGAHVAEGGAQLVEIAGVGGGRQLDDYLLYTSRCV